MSFSNENQVDDRLIDRLVDGELEETERQRLLALLETEPGGWRRCALAFLEAQAWTRTFASAPETESIDSGHHGMTTHSLINSGRPAKLIRRRDPVRRRFQKAGSLAAGILIAFASGWIASGATRPFSPASAPLPIGGVAERLKSSNGPKLASNQGRESTEPPLVPQLKDPSWKAEAPLVLTDPVRRELERQGYHVEQRSGLVSMELENGQSLAVPVDELELRYIGNRTY